MIHVSTKTKILIIDLSILALSIASLVLYALAIYFSTISINLSLVFGGLGLAFAFISYLLTPMTLDDDP